MYFEDSRTSVVVHNSNDGSVPMLKYDSFSYIPADLLYDITIGLVRWLNLELRHAYADWKLRTHFQYELFNALCVNLECLP